MHSDVGSELIQSRRISVRGVTSLIDLSSHCGEYRPIGGDCRPQMGVGVGRSHAYPDWRWPPRHAAAWHLCVRRGPV